jgi:hypothetical protein
MLHLRHFADTTVMWFAGGLWSALYAIPRKEDLDESDVAQACVLGDKNLQSITHTFVNVDLAPVPAQESVASCLLDHLTNHLATYLSGLCRLNRILGSKFTPSGPARNAEARWAAYLTN